MFLTLLHTHKIEEKAFFPPSVNLVLVLQIQFGVVQRFFLMLILETSNNFLCRERIKTTLLVF